MTPCHDFDVELTKFERTPGLRIGIETVAKTANSLDATGCSAELVSKPSNMRIDRSRVDESVDAESIGGTQAGRWAAVARMERSAIRDSRIPLRFMRATLATLAPLHTGYTLRVGIDW